MFRSISVSSFNLRYTALLCSFRPKLTLYSIAHLVSVSRIDAKSENYDTEITLDINSEIYPLKEGHKFEILLADRLYEDAADESEVAGYDPSRPLDSRAQSFEYIMHGKIFKYSEEKSRA